MASIKAAGLHAHGPLLNLQQLYQLAKQEGQDVPWMGTC